MTWIRIGDVLWCFEGKVTIEKAKAPDTTNTKYGIKVQNPQGVRLCFETDNIVANELVFERIAEMLFCSKIVETDNYIKVS